MDREINRVEPLVIDCDTCQVRGAACTDCVVSVLLGAPPAVAWDDDERRAIDALVDGGLVPRLRLMPPPSPPPPGRQRPRRAG